MFFQQGVRGARALTWGKPGVAEAPAPCTGCSRLRARWGSQGDAGKEG